MQELVEELKALLGADPLLWHTLATLLVLMLLLALIWLVRTRRRKPFKSETSFSSNFDLKKFVWNVKYTYQREELESDTSKDPP